MAAGKMYSFEEVRKHNGRDDCWLIISGKVYDVTPYMSEHPGGDEVLLACTGKDATTDFDDIGHTETAKEHMREYCIGEVDAATVPTKLGYTASKETALIHERGTWLTVLQVAVPAVVMLMAFAFKSFANIETE